MKHVTDPFHFSGQQFDALLDHALLSTEKNFNANENLMETMAQHIFSPEYSAVLSESKSNLLIEKLTADFNKPTKSRFSIFFFILAAAGILAVILFFSLRKPELKSSSAIVPATAQKITSREPLSYTSAQELISNPSPVVNPSILALIDSAAIAETGQMINGKAPDHSIPTKLYIPESYPSYIDVPELTEAEIKQTAKQKLQLMRDISKKRNYGSLPPGKVSVEGKLVNVDGFSIQNTEVTNLEYRTFLNDLLVQGKFEMYQQAKPVSGGWKAAGVPAFEDKYWQTKAYDDFPAVNMTRKGAELYCDWLTTSMNEAIASKEVKWSGSKNPDFRLPSNTEWIYAARNCDSTTVKYPWAKVIPDSVHNHRGCFFCNFNYKASEDYFKNITICPGFGRLKQGGFHQPVITSAGMAIDTLLTAPVFSYNPNEWGQYCMMGNVSEMVWTYQANQPTVKGAARSLGGNWNSYVTNVQIEPAEQYVGVTEASAMIGFRPLMNGYFNYSMMRQVKFK